MSDTTLPGPAPAAPSPDSIFEQIGGRPAVAIVVDDFYDRVLRDPDLRPYFAPLIEHPDGLRRLRAHQRAFVERALGGERNYRGRPLDEAHHHLGITQEHFDRVLQHLGHALAAAGVPDATVDAIGSALAPLATEIVTR